MFNWNSVQKALDDGESVNDYEGRYTPCPRCKRAIPMIRQRGVPVCGAVLTCVCEERTEVVYFNPDLVWERPS